MGLYIKDFHFVKENPVRDFLLRIEDDGTAKVAAIGYPQRTYEAKLIGPHGDLIDSEELKNSHCAECTLYPDKCLGDECDWSSIVHLRMMNPVIEKED